MSSDVEKEKADLYEVINRLKEKKSIIETKSNILLIILDDRDSLRK